METKHRYVLVGLRPGNTLTPDQSMTIRAAIAALAAPWDRGQPSEMFQIRLSLDGSKAIYEITYPAEMTAWDALNAAASAVQMSVYDLVLAAEFMIFDENGTLAGSLAAHGEEWEQPES
jgi:hypothetical protein